MKNVEPVGVSGRSDTLKWCFIVLIVLGSAIGNVLYAETYGLALRLSVVILVGCVALWVASHTHKGATALKFIKEARVELKKIVWPNRQETIQTTLIVMAFVTVMSIVLWALDGLFAQLVSKIVA